MATEIALHRHAAPALHFRFSDLPGELRNRIYALVVDDPGYLTDPWGRQFRRSSALCAVSRAIRLEFLPFHYATCTLFGLTPAAFAALHTHLAAIGPANSSLVRRLNVTRIFGAPKPAHRSLGDLLTADTHGDGAALAHLGTALRTVYRELAYLYQFLDPLATVSLKVLSWLAPILDAWHGGTSARALKALMKLPPRKIGQRYAARLDELAEASYPGWRVFRGYGAFMDPGFVHTCFFDFAAGACLVHWTDRRQERAGGVDRVAEALDRCEALRW